MTKTTQEIIPGKTWKQKCIRCNYEWVSRLKKPYSCSRCRSPYWYKERIRNVTHKQYSKEDTRSNSPITKTLTIFGDVHSFLKNKIFIPFEEFSDPKFNRLVEDALKAKYIDEIQPQFEITKLTSNEIYVTNVTPRFGLPKSVKLVYNEKDNSFFCDYHRITSCDCGHIKYILLDDKVEKKLKKNTIWKNRILPLPSYKKNIRNNKLDDSISGRPYIGIKWKLYSYIQKKIKEEASNCNCSISDVISNCLVEYYS